MITPVTPPGTPPVTSPGASAADTSAPLLTLSTPNTTTSSANVALAGSASDNVGVVGISWSNSLGGSGSATLTGSTTAPAWSVPSVPLVAGVNVLTVQARDAAGNLSAANQVSVTYSAPVTPPAVAGTYYLSPTGSNGNDGKTGAKAWKTFAYAFVHMAAGDELVLLDGNYGDAQGTGMIGCQGGGLCDGGVNTAAPPSGISLAKPTLVRALNPGQVVLNGHLMLGRTDRKDRYIRLQGLRIEGGVDLYNTAFVTLKDSGVHGALGIGTNDHSQGNTDNLIEDVWVWASGERLIAVNYQADRNVWRRVIVRGDGCGTASCQGSGNPNVGISVYESVDVSLQNVMVVDRILAAGDTPYGDFTVAAHATLGLRLGRAEWLGVLSVKAPDSGFNMDPDGPAAVTSPTLTIRNAMVYGSAGDGLYLAKAGLSDVFDHISVFNAKGSGMTADSSLTNPTLRNVLISQVGTGVNDYGLYFTPSGSTGPDGVAIFGASGDAVQQYSKVCQSACYTTNPRADGSPASVRYPVRVETGSLLKGKGVGGGDIGANVELRYGVDGSRFGETAYNTQSATKLWPWPQEARIKAEMCAGTTRGFCTTGKRLDGTNPVTLTSYVWELLGNPLPTGVYP